MSWVLASFLLLGLALVAGFGWYERSHPNARVLALVATLAALAALGRIAFAPLPKQDTDKVPLGGISWGMIERVSADPDLVLEAKLPGTGKDGGPSCATVHPPLGWRPERRTP